LDEKAFVSVKRISAFHLGTLKLTKAKEKKQAFTVYLLLHIKWINVCPCGPARSASAGGKSTMLNP